MDEKNSVTEQERQQRIFRILKKFIATLDTVSRNDQRDIIEGLYCHYFNE